MESAFQALEDKVRRTAEALQALRKQNASLQKEQARLKSQLEDARKKVHTLEAKQGGDDSDALAEEITRLRREREELRNRIARMIETLESLG